MAKKRKAKWCKNKATADCNVADRGVIIALSSTSTVSVSVTRCLWFQRRDNRPKLITRFSDDDDDDVVDSDVMLPLLLTGVVTLTHAILLSLCVPLTVQFSMLTPDYIYTFIHHEGRHTRENMMTDRQTDN